VERGAAFERKVHEDAVARQHREAARRKKHVLRAAEEARAAEHATASVAPCTVAERSVLWRRIDAVVARYRAANRRALALLLCGLAAIVASALLPSLLLAGFRAQLLDELVLGGPAGAAAAIPQFGGRAASLANRSAAPATFGAWLHECEPPPPPPPPNGNPVDPAAVRAAFAAGAGERVAVVHEVMIFNVTNAAAVLAGRSLPVLRQVGPYRFRRRWRKLDVAFFSSFSRSEDPRFRRANNRVRYTERSSYEFLPPAASALPLPDGSSGGNLTLDDGFTALNLGWLRVLGRLRPYGGDDRYLVAHFASGVLKDFELTAKRKLRRAGLRRALLALPAAVLARREAVVQWASKLDKRGTYSSPSRAYELHHEVRAPYRLHRCRRRRLARGGGC